MDALKFRADYELLEGIVKQFDRASANTRQTLDALHRQVDVLMDGAWRGQSATRFYQEMITYVLPSVKRLADALEHAARITQKMNRIAQQAETDAAALFKTAAPDAATTSGEASATAGPNGAPRDAELSKAAVQGSTPPDWLAKGTNPPWISKDMWNAMLPEERASVLESAQVIWDARQADPGPKGHQYVVLSTGANIDLGHLEDTANQALILYNNLLAARGKGVTVVESPAHPMGPKLPFKLKYWVQIPENASDAEVQQIALGIFMDYERKYEDAQLLGPLIDWGNRSSFAPEDLPSDYLGFMAAIHNNTGSITNDDLMKVVEWAGGAKSFGTGRTSPMDTDQSWDAVFHTSGADVARNYEFTPRIWTGTEFKNIDWPPMLQMQPMPMATFWSDAPIVPPVPAPPLQNVP